MRTLDRLHAACALELKAGPSMPARRTKLAKAEGLKITQGPRPYRYGYHSSKRTSMPVPASAFWNTPKSEPR